jgi:hypothetical protein
MARNILNDLTEHQLTEIIQRHHNPGTADLSSEEVFRRIADDAVRGTYIRRSENQALTGEWIIFAKHQGENYYLTLGTHDEGDGEAFARIAAQCFAEYPFLAS